MTFHPLGLRPLGNSFQRECSTPAGRVYSREELLGNLNVFSTDALFNGLLHYLGPEELTTFGSLNSFTFALCFTADEAVWKNHALDIGMEGTLRISGIHPGIAAAKVASETGTDCLLWRRIYAYNVELRQNEAKNVEDPIPCWSKRPSCIPVRSYLFDDLMFNHYLLRHMTPMETADHLSDLVKLSDNLPTSTDVTGHSIKWMNRETAPNPEYFESRLRYSPGTPTIIRDIMDAWNIDEWTRPSLVDKLADAAFLCGRTTIRLTDFLWYSDKTRDECPLFIFCPDILREEKGGYLLQACRSVPDYWSDELDAFKTLPKEIQPKNRWILWGNQWTGSKWHQDPNGTEAWNAVFGGRKLWLFSPPNLPPPGVVKMDQDVLQPESMREWFEHFFDICCNLDYMQIGIQHPGEVVYVPQRWWHCVLNLDNDTIAITGNLAPLSKHTMPGVRHFMKFQKDSISGVPRSARSILDKTLDEAVKKAANGKWKHLVDEDVTDPSKTKKKSLWATLMEEEA